MPRATLPVTLTLVISFIVGCTPALHPHKPVDAHQLFSPVSMRIHPIFTQPKDWTGDGVIDGVEALLEFQDQFTDPTKAAGDVVFELYAYRPNSPDGRGERVVNPWLGSLRTLAEQEARWNRTSRTYAFELEYPQIREDRDYVLVATFDTGRTRFFDQIVLEGRRAPRGQRIPATQRSASTPSHVATRP